MALCNLAVTQTPIATDARTTESERAAFSPKVTCLHLCYVGAAAATFTLTPLAYRRIDVWSACHNHLSRSPLGASDITPTTRGPHDPQT